VFFSTINHIQLLDLCSPTLPVRKCPHWFVQCFHGFSKPSPRPVGILLWGDWATVVFPFGPRHWCFLRMTHFDDFFWSPLLYTWSNYVKLTQISQHFPIKKAGAESEYVKITPNTIARHHSLRCHQLHDSIWLVGSLAPQQELLMILRCFNVCFQEKWGIPFIFTICIN
jgi:hypothetical protein